MPRLRYTPERLPYHCSSGTCKRDFKAEIHHYAEDPNASDEECPNCSEKGDYTECAIIHLLIDNPKHQFVSEAGSTKRKVAGACSFINEKIESKVWAGTFFTTEENAATCYDCLKIAGFFEKTKKTKEVEEKVEEKVEVPEQKKEDSEEKIEANIEFSDLPDLDESVPPQTTKETSSPRKKKKKKK